MSAPNSHGACHDLALGPVPKQNARSEEREGVPPTPARARAIRSPAPTEPPSSRSSPTTINPPQARASRALQVSQARRRPQVSRITLFVELPDRRPDRFGRPARRPRPRTPPSFRLIGLIYARGGWPNPRARSSRTPERPQRASPALRSPPPLSKQGHLGRIPFPAVAVAAPPDARLPFLFPHDAAMDPTTTRRTRRTSTSCTRCCAWSATRRRMPRSTRIPRSRRGIESQTRRRASRRTPRSSRRKTFRIRVARRSIGRCSSAAGSSWRRVGSLTGRRMRFSTTRSFRASARGWRRLATAPTSPARGRS